MLFYAERGSRPGPALLDLAAEGGSWREAVAGRVAGVDDDPTRSMMAIECPTEAHHGLREGSWYDIPNDTWAGFHYSPVDWNAVVGRLISRGMTNFAQFRTRKPPDLISHSARSAADLQEYDPSAGLELRVIDCGQGNWNEIIANHLRMIYDTGCSFRWSRAQVQRFVAERGIADTVTPIMVVVSHWDIDHYQTLLRWTPAEIGRIRAFLAPSQVPANQTSLRVLKALDASAVPVLLWPPANGDGSRRIVLERQAPADPPFTWLRASKGASRNQTGIAVFVSGPNADALLTGDHHYEKLHESLKGLPRRRLHLVVPHHGGHAGKLSWAQWQQTGVAAISCGQNNYKHPLTSVLRGLPVTPFRTDQSGHGTWQL